MKTSLGIGACPPPGRTADIENVEAGCGCVAGVLRSDDNRVIQGEKHFRGCGRGQGKRGLRRQAAELFGANGRAEVSDGGARQEARETR